MAEGLTPDQNKREWIRVVIEHWVEHPHFRHEMRIDQRKALKDAGIELTDDQFKIVEMGDWKAKNPPATDVGVLDRLFEFWMFGTPPAYW